MQTHWKRFTPQNPFAYVLLLVTVGCEQRPDVMAPPPWNPTATGQRAIELYDTNHDGTINGTELQQCPGLQDSLLVADFDADGALSAEEISARVEWYKTSGFVLVPFEVQIKNAGEPVVGAKVTMIPEKLFVDTIEHATGITDSVGRVTPTIDHPDTTNSILRGLRPGMYRCQISVRNLQEDKTPPDTYDTVSEFGFEIGPGHHVGGLTIIDIVSGPQTVRR